jgi:TetR/AcrR family transcriptional regulator, fatty acid metabolism regulator protein
MTAHSAAATDKRERILDAAERVFAQRGFFHARVSEIARDAGVADGTIYLYFKSKDDLLISLFETRMERVSSAITAALATAGDAPPARLAAFVGTYADLVAQNPALAEVLVVELRQSAKFMKQGQNPAFGEFLKVLAGIIADGQQRGAFEPSPPAPIAARAIFGMLDELALAWVLGRDRPERFDIVHAADTVGAFVLRGLERRTP